LRREVHQKGAAASKSRREIAERVKKNLDFVDTTVQEVPFRDPNSQKVPLSPPVGVIQHFLALTDVHGK
jgi:hypothetical protein